MATDGLLSRKVDATHADVKRIEMTFWRAPPHTRANAQLAGAGITIEAAAQPRRETQ